MLTMTLISMKIFINMFCQRSIPLRQNRYNIFIILQNKIYFSTIFYLLSENVDLNSDITGLEKVIISQLFSYRIEKIECQNILDNFVVSILANYPEKDLINIRNKLLNTIVNKFNNIFMPVISCKKAPIQHLDIGIFLLFIFRCRIYSRFCFRTI